MTARRRALLLGEGDFSFALALREVVGAEMELIATGFDSEAVVYERYPWARRTLKDLRDRRVEVRHGVDATAAPEEIFSEVVFTHPHLGQEDAKKHHSLLCHFFRAYRDSNAPVRVTLAGDQPERWRAKEAAKRQGFSFMGSTPFFDRQFIGYERKRSLGGKSFRSRIGQQSTTLSFSTRELSDHERQPFWAEFVRDYEEAHPRPLFGCDVCGKEFKSLRSLETHRLHAPHSKKRQICDICGHTFADDLGLQRHKLAKHQLSPEDLKPDWYLRQQASPTITHDDGKCLCDICGLAFLDDIALKNHLDNDFQPKDPPLEIALCCDLCGRTFRDNRALQQHRLYAHPP